MNPAALTSGNELYEVRGDAMVHKSAVVGAGSVLGPRVVIGPDCEVGEGVRLEGTALLRGTRVQVAEAPPAKIGTVRAVFVSRGACGSPAGPCIYAYAYGYAYV